MERDERRTRTIRWVLSVLLVALGLSVSWAWGRVARLAELPAAPSAPQETVLYAAWQPAEAAQAVLFHSMDGGATWQPMELPMDAAPVVWADDGGQRVAVALDDGSLLRSEDRGKSWTSVPVNLPILSLVWDSTGNLYLGTDRQGIHRFASDGRLTALDTGRTGTTAGVELASAPIAGLSLVEGRLFAATPNVLFCTDDGGGNWIQSQPVPGLVSTLVALDRQTVYVGTQVEGVYRSVDAGQTWQPAFEGLGLAAGQMVKVTALKADPAVPGVLYAAADYVVGGTEVYGSAAGTFVTLDNGSLWQPLAGPAFPDARPASSLVVLPDRPLSVEAVTAAGLQEYLPDVPGALAALQDGTPQVRANAARLLGLARSQEASQALVGALADPDPAVSLAAAQALGQIDDPATVNSLLVALDHPDLQVRLGAARALGVMRVEAAVDPLRAMLVNGGELEVGVAAEALGHIGGPAATDALLTALQDPGPTSRWHAAMAALEAMGEPAVGPLVKMLDGDKVYARRSAAEALGWIGSPSATQALVRALKDRDATMRSQTAWALGEIGDPTAQAALERIQARDPEPEVQAAARQALSQLSEAPATASRWPAFWARALRQLQPMRWLILGSSLVGAVWLSLGGRQLSPALLWQRRR
jgi:HEAT repeat protein